MNSRIPAACLAAVSVLFALDKAHADGSPATLPANPAQTIPAVVAPQSGFALYGQVTYTGQVTDHFHAPYAGPNSLPPAMSRETIDATLYLGTRLWRGAEFWVNPEADRGFGPDNTIGLAGSTGEANKVGRNAPYFRLQRAFVRQTLNLGGEIGSGSAGPDQFAIPQSADRLVFTLGKMSVGDIFDANRYAHDPRSDFINWSVIDAGTFDCAADAWGYTVGGTAEWYVGSWAWRAGVFDLSDVPGGARLAPGFRDYQVDLEAEHRHELFGQPGRIVLTVFENRGRMALLQDAIALGEADGSPPDLAPVRHYRKRDGVSLNVEQQLTTDIGLFMRLGDAGGNVETYEFTDIDHSMSMGVSVNGAAWKRAGDTVGAAGVINALSKGRRQYLAKGGLGLLIGDGRLPHAGHEDIAEMYYELAVVSALQVTLDYQWVGNPAYNRDRGPASIIALRIHAEI